MRRIGTLDNEKSAQKFCDYLTTRDIENKIERENENNWDVWVYDEDKVEAAREMLEEFISNPDDPEYETLAREAKRVRKNQEKERKPRSQYIDVRTQVFYRGLNPQGGLTLVLIGISVAVSLLSRFGADRSLISFLFITEMTREGAFITWIGGLPEIMNGQVWRIFTPIFIHFGLLHLLFNMLWLNDLGNMIENRKGRSFFIIQLLAIAGVSNLAQYWVSGPSFGGMSGVIYGFLGYAWMKGKYDPISHISVDKRTMTMMLIWYVLCFTGIVGDIANTAHTAGLVLGTAWGFLTTNKPRQMLRNWKRKTQ